MARATISFTLHRISRWSEPDGALSRVLAKLLAGTSNFLRLLASLLVGLSMLDLTERWLTRVGSLWLVVAALQVTNLHTQGMLCPRRQQGCSHYAPRLSCVGVQRVAPPFLSCISSSECDRACPVKGFVCLK